MQKDSKTSTILIRRVENQLKLRFKSNCALLGVSMNERIKQLMEQDSKRRSYKKEETTNDHSRETKEDFSAGNPGEISQSQDGG